MVSKCITLSHSSVKCCTRAGQTVVPLKHAMPFMSMRYPPCSRYTLTVDAIPFIFKLYPPCVSCTLHKQTVFSMSELYPSCPGWTFCVKTITLHAKIIPCMSKLSAFALIYLGTLPTYKSLFIYIHQNSCII